MASFRIGIGVVWGLFWIGWLVSAFTAKRGTRNTGSFGVRIAIIVVLAVSRPLWRHGDLTIHSWALMIVGAALLLCGFAIAIWARLTMGRNWGMPMTLKNEPELVQDGPYRYVRHPIYSGLILAFIGTTLATSLFALIPGVLLSVYFIWSARTEEGILSQAMPGSYPDYMRHTKMLVPFVF